MKQAAPNNFISGPSLSISLPSPSNRQITPLCRRYEISRKLDSEDTIKASDSETVISLSQQNFISRGL
jgi:hypothetical protein